MIKNFDYIEKYKKIRPFWRNATKMLFVVVVFVTTYMLILPAITVESKLVCDLKEHTHNKECYDGNNVLICNQTAHIHTEGCYRVKETREDWEKSIKNAKITNNWSHDLVEIAKTQLGYTESDSDYIVNQNNEKKGYTRYGEWYSQPYEDWDAMYVAFCMHYAGIDEKIVPVESNCQKWVETLSNEQYQLFYQKDKYTPVPGDLIFFESDNHLQSQHVGIVVEVNNNEIKTIEGDSQDKVQYQTYSLTDEKITGYLKLPEQTENETNLTETYSMSYKDDQVIIIASYTDDAKIPENAKLEAYPINEETSKEIYNKRQKQIKELVDNKNNESLLYNIGFYVDGKEIEPQDKVSITIQFLNTDTIKKDDAITILHFKDDHIETLEGTNVVENENGYLSTSFETTSFSDFALLVNDITAYAENEETKEVSTQEDFDNLIKNPDFNGTIMIMSDLKIDSSNRTDGKAPQLDSEARNVTIDLNSYHIEVNGTLVDVVNGAHLTITDNHICQETINQQEISGYPKEANIAKLENDENGYPKELTYYVTTSEIKNDNTKETKETLEIHTVNFSNIGSIKGTNPGNAVIYVWDGKVDFNGGVIAGSSGRAIVIGEDNGNGEINLKGGYICGNDLSENINSNEDNDNTTYPEGHGGAIRAQSGTINLNGTVIAGNTAKGNGGAIALFGYTTLNINDGVISGNTSLYDDYGWQPFYGGGGLYCTNNSTVNMNGGYISNNKSSHREANENDEDKGRDYFHGGGGVFLSGSSSFNLKGGYITGNESGFGGGGIRTDYQVGGNLTMTGGYVCSNIAQRGEAGGIYINDKGYGEIKGGYINNNITYSQQHWGGGGIFCANGGTLLMQNILVTENKAGGYGGGISGCSTGRIFMVGENTGAIYSNSAEGEHLSGDNSYKGEDHLYGDSNEFFKQYGYQDYFCALNSSMSDTMLGGGSHSWIGSADGLPVQSYPGDVLQANYIMGLTSQPTTSDISKAQTEAKVFITGNSAYTHGGGVLCNGYLIIGSERDVSTGSRLVLNAEKTLYDNNNVKVENQKDYQFEFELVDEKGSVVALGKNDEKGHIEFDRRLPFNAAGTYTYYLKEREYKDSTILSDSSEYKITVTVNDKVNTINPRGGENIINLTYYYISQIEIAKKIDNEWKKLQNNTYNDSDNEDKAVELNFPYSFKNYIQDATNITVKKEWVTPENATTHPDKITVKLYQNDNIYNDAVELNAYNNWIYTWNNLPTNDGQGNVYKYRVEEENVSGYITSYSTSTSNKVFVKANSIVDGKKYIIVSPDKKHILNPVNVDKDAVFDTNDVLSPVSYTNNQVVISDYNCVFDAYSYTPSGPTDGREPQTGIVLKQNDADRWLLTQKNGTGEDVFKGTIGVTWASYFTYTEGKIMSSQNWNNKPDDYIIAYDSDSNKFIVVEANREFAQNDSIQPALLYVEADSSQQGSVVTITNTKAENINYKLNITKVNASDENILIKGAKFKIFNEENHELHFSGTNGNYKLDESGTDTLETVEYGKLVINDLPEGKYVIKEIEAPNGYELAEEKIVELGENNSSTTIKVTIEDKQKLFVLPETGGMGTIPFIISGITLICLGLLLMIYRKPIKRKVGEH